MWIHHLISLLASAVNLFIEAIGTTLLGLMLGILFLLASTASVLLRVYKKHGKDAMLTHWKEDANIALRIAGLCAVILYGPIAVWKLSQAVYEDHMGLVARSQSQRQQIRTRDEQSTSAKEHFSAELSKSQTECANLQGANGVLSNQNRDQQGTINNCQTEALKLLEPEPFKITPLLLEDHGSPGFDNRYRKFLLLTNRIVTPARILLTCDRPIDGLYDNVLPEGAIMGGNKSVPPNSWGFSIDSPPWTPVSPIVITVYYVSPSQKPIECIFNQQ